MGQRVRFLALLVSQGLLGFAFLLAGLSKVADGPGFLALRLRSLQVFPADWAGLIAGTVPWCEIGLGLWLLVGIAPCSAAITAAVVLLLFSALLLRLGAIVGWRSDCGCLVVIPAFSTIVGAVARNCLPIALCIVVARLRKPSLQAALGRRHGSFDNAQQEPRQLPGSQNSE